METAVGSERDFIILSLKDAQSFCRMIEKEHEISYQNLKEECGWSTECVE